MPRSFIQQALLPVILFAILVPSVSGETREYQYSGTLTQKVRRGETPPPAKEFELYTLLTSSDAGQECFHFVSERGGGGWAWPERFGAATIGQNNRRTGGGDPPALV